jgi:arabinosaccharide transport system permease protein
MKQTLQASSRSKLKGTTATIFIYLVLALVCIFALIPFYFMLVSSAKSGMELVRNGINIDLPISKLTLNGYQSLFTNRDGIYFSWYKNSLVITFFQVICSIFLAQW